jgi:hypothetical protein
VSRGNATISRHKKEDKSVVQQEDEERRCTNKLVRREDKRVAQQEDGERQCNINFKRAITVDCSELMPLKEELPLHHLDGETLFVKVGKVGCHKEVLVVLWRHTQSFR